MWLCFLWGSIQRPDKEIIIIIEERMVDKAYRYGWPVGGWKNVARREREIVTIVLLGWRDINFRYGLHFLCIPYYEIAYTYVCVRKREREREMSYQSIQLYRDCLEMDKCSIQNVRSQQWGGFLVQEIGKSRCAHQNTPEFHWLPRLHPLGRFGWPQRRIDQN